MEHMSLKGKKVLITGAYGFIGSHLVSPLLDEGAEVSVLVREHSNPWRLKEKLHHVCVYKGDVADSLRVSQIVHTIKPDFIFHLAAYGVDRMNKQIQQAIKTNIIGTVNIIEAAIAANCEKVINLGSSLEYGYSDQKLSEDMRLNPLDIYGSTKAASTILAHQIAKAGNLKLVTIRLFNTFGEKEAPQKLFSYVILQLLKDKEVKLSSGEQYRDYLYIENYIDGLILAAKNKNVQNDILNMGSGQALPIKFYVQKLFQLIDPEKKPLFGTISYTENDRMLAEPDIQKVKDTLKWQQRISLEEGMERTINWYKENLHQFNDS
jgi:nucleoside-diphosphate-sugar epimerase